MKDRSPFPLAGLWRAVEIEGRPVVTAGIITTSPNRIVEPIHDRMPVILGETETIPWLDPSVGDFPALHSLLRPFPHSEMEAYAVSDAVNNSRFDSPECVEPLEDTASGRE